MKDFEQVISFVRDTFKQPKGFIPLHEPRFWGNEKKYLNECIDSTFVSSVGEYVDKFEEEVAKYTGAKKAVVCVNGTSVPDSVPDNVPDKRQAVVLELIKENNQILLKDLAITLQVSTRTIRRDIEKLKKMNQLKRVGPEKGGHWKISDL